MNTSLLHFSFDGFKLVSELGEKSGSLYHTSAHLSETTKMTF